MKLEGFVLTAGLVASLQPGVTLAGGTTNVATVSRSAPFPRVGYTNPIVGSTSMFPFRFNLSSAPAKSPASNSPAPGVYITEPHTCIVVVPGRHPDEARAVNPTHRTAPMPTIQPDVRLIPQIGRDTS